MHILNSRVSTLPDSTVVFYDDAGLIPMEAEPQSAAAEILTFLSSLASGTQI
ncbi:MAG: hypothetical protein WD002_00655 [Pseudomonadales bacterium]